MRHRLPTLVLFLAVFVAPASAGAATARHAIPSGGAPPGPCASGNACTLPDAVAAAQPGDEVVVHAGTYTLTTALEIADQVNLHGAVGEARPRLTGGAAGLAGHLVGITDTGTRIADV